MAKLTEPIVRMIRHPDTRKVMATVTPGGRPHVIVCGSLTTTEDDMIVVGDVYMHRTAENLAGCPAVEFMVWNGRDAYSIVAEARERLTSGPEFDKMTNDLGRMNMDVTAVWLFEPLEVWDESASRTAGTRVI